MKSKGMTLGEDNLYIFVEWFFILFCVVFFGLPPPCFSLTWVAHGQAEGMSDCVLPQCASLGERTFGVGGGACLVRGWLPTVFGYVVLGPAQDLPITGRFMATAYLSPHPRGRYKECTQCFTSPNCCLGAALSYRPPHRCRAMSKVKQN